MSTIMNFVVSRLGEARYLFVVGLVFALIGTLSLGLAALVPQPTHQNRNGVTAPREAHQTSTRTSAPEPAHIIPVPPLPDRLLMLPSGGLECLSDEVITCTAHLTRDASVAEVAAYLHTKVSAIRKLNPRLQKNRLKKGDEVVITNCMDRNTVPPLPETTGCRLARLKLRPDDARIGDPLASRRHN